ncbi:MAG: TIGR03435 family protein [Acidobacteria bacterium]|nr:TIGR03435 family protein [Acidobacteriota bacterium]
MRYALWLAESIKFLVPFSLFIAIGNSIDFGERQSPPAVQPAITFVQEISLPFDSTAALTAIPVAEQPHRSSLLWNIGYLAWICGCLAVLVTYLAKGRRVKAVARNASPITQGRSFEALQRIMGDRTQVRLAYSASSIQPGVFGIIHPVLLLPEGMSDRLSDAELEAIIAHELAHVRRRDNLFSAIHMFVEALFWFHPMVWWIGAKLIQERERACDEDVLSMGKDPQAYARGILKVCELYLESPLACIAGVTGADMKKRIHTIMCQHIVNNVGWTKRMVLAAAGATALAAPIMFGLFRAPQIRAQSQSALKPSFEVASVRPTDSCYDTGGSIGLVSGPVAPPRPIPFAPTGFEGGRYSGCDSLKKFMEEAYQTEVSMIHGGPAWTGSARYRIDAKTDPSTPRNQMRLMLQSLLEERFKLKIHRTPREIEVY